MKGFKSVNELSLKECYDFLTSEENKKKSLYPAIAEWYEEMLHELVKQDESDYAACKTIANHEAYIRKFSDINVAPYYNAKHISEAKNNIEDLFWNSHKNSVGGCKEYLNRYPTGKYASTAYSRIGSSKKTGWLILGIILLVIVIAFFIGYKPVNSLSVSESDLSFSKWGGLESVHVSTNVPTNAFDVHCSGEGFSIDSDYGHEFKVSAEPNEGDFRTGNVKVTAYATLYGMRIGIGESVSTGLSQESGLAHYMNITESNIHFKKYSSDIRTVFATTDGVNMKVSTDGIDDDWLGVSYDISNEGDNNKAKIVISSHKNEGGEKHGTILISCNSHSKRINISQESGLAKRFDVNKSSMLIAEEGSGEGYFLAEIYTDGTTWSVKEAPSWLTTEVVLASKEGDKGYLKIRIPENTNKIKEGTITLMSNNGDLKEIDIKQWGDPTNFSASRSSIKFGTSKYYENVGISNDSRKPLLVSDDKSWITATARSKSEVRISCSENNYGSPRMGTVDVRCGGEHLSITVKQDGWETCSRCDGSGYVDCNGGWITMYGGRIHTQQRMVYNWDAWGNMYPYVVTDKCSACGGDGQIECSRCHGKGKTKKSY